MVDIVSVFRPWRVYETMGSTRHEPRYVVPARIPTTKLNRITQEQSAKLQNVSARSIQRARRIMREAPELALLIQAGKIKLGFAEKLLRLAQKKRTTMMAAA
jgi:hypothetical protein